ncbi:Bax inhibitor-1/YccA family protein [Streptomyces sp. Q6]|uniref:Bax inhibitor-1/YccA family protein n=1 Tax=Streptomyces citrinus TaxID=3118173 RepID=A0ACD5A4L2_9ACTN
MKSSNPIFSHWGATDGAGRADSHRKQPVGTYGGGARVDDHLSDPYAHGVGLPSAAPLRSNAVTMDDVVVRTGMTLGTVTLTAVLSWLLLPVDEADLGMSYGLAVGAAFIAFGLSMVQVFKRTPSPALILGYAAFEGVFLGVLSSTVSTYLSPGVVGQAVLGTFAVSAGVLLAYRRRWIRVDRRFAGFVTAAATGFLLLLVADSLFALFGAGEGLGFRSGGLGIAFGVVGVLLGAAFLAMDFRQVEDAVAFGAPREEAWLAAFGITTTLVWIYLEVLRVLTIFNSDN